jgi:hypothetical protein
MTDKVIDSIVNGDAVDVVAQVAQELGQRALDQLAQAKLDAARAMFQPEIDVEEVEQDYEYIEEPEVEQEEELEADDDQLDEEIVNEGSDEDTEATN